MTVADTSVVISTILINDMKAYKEIFNDLLKIFLSSSPHVATREVLFVLNHQNKFKEECFLSFFVTRLSFKTKILLA